MKKLLALLLSLAMALSLAACGGGETAQQEPGGDAAGETYSFSVGTNTAEDSVNHLLAAKFKELIEDRSDGAVTVTLYENALGGDAELTESCIAGSVDFIVGMTGSLVNYIPEAALFDLPNVFPDLETAREVLDGPILAEGFPRALIGIFGAANESVYYTDFALRAFRIYLCMLVLACVNKACFIFLQAMGKAAASTALSMVREIVFGVGFLPLFWGLDGVLWSMPVSDILTFAISAVLIVRTDRELRGEGKACRLA